MTLAERNKIMQGKEDSLAELCLQAMTNALVVRAGGTPETVVVDENQKFIDRKPTLSRDFPGLAIASSDDAD